MPVFKMVNQGRYVMKFLLLVLAIHFIAEVVVKKIKQRKVLGAERRETGDPREI
jgi:hypothetical protein